uniref:CUB domain-containing protein n=1 Tax=Heterorhabditis bacteriophora TaxID=37862 RepID=A0A1I7X709_HETBA
MKKQASKYFIDTLHCNYRPCIDGAPANVVCIQNMNFAQYPFKLIFKTDNESDYISLKYQEESNFFFYSNVTLEAKKYEVSGIFVAPFLGHDILIRFWTPKMNTSVEIEYYSLDNTLLPDGPNEIDGAAVKVSIKNCSKEMSLKVSAFPLLTIKGENILLDFTHFSLSN